MNEYLNYQKVCKHKVLSLNHLRVRSALILLILLSCPSLNRLYYLDFTQYLYVHIVIIELHRGARAEFHRVYTYGRKKSPDRWCTYASHQPKYLSLSMKITSLLKKEERGKGKGERRKEKGERRKSGWDMDQR